MTSFHRRVTPKVVSGKAQKKNRDLHSEYAPGSSFNGIQIERQRPGRGFRHLLSRSDIQTFVGLIPDWDHASHGLNTIVLATRELGKDGWYRNGTIGIGAWERGLWRTSNQTYFQDHRELFGRLNIKCEHSGANVVCRFTENSARAYLLLHVFLHELGHHRDAMMTRSKNVSRGEEFAENWTFLQEQALWDAYQRAFGLL